MPNFNLLSAAVLTSALLAGTTCAVAENDPTGVWLNDTGRGAVEIKPCGDKLCGHVVWVKDGADAKGCGKQIIGNVRSVGGGRWDNGWIYSPEKKRNYDVEIRPLDDGKLRVTGYAGLKFLSKTMIWTKAPADLVRCNAPGTDAAAPVPPATPEIDAKAPAPAAAPVASASPAPAPTANATPAAEADKGAAQPAPAADTAAAPAAVPAPTDQAANGTDASASGPTDGGASGQTESGIAGALGKLGDLDLENVLTKSSDGKCKLDLPWVKVKFDCEK